MAAAAPVAAAAAPAFDAAFAPTAGIPFDEDLISERDFDVAGVGSVPKQEKKEEINIGKGPVGPRGSKTYKVPGIMTLVAGILNFIGDVTLIVLAAITVSKMTNADIGIYIWVSIVGFFSILDAVRISLGSIAVLTRSSRPRVFLACSELLFAPVFGTLLASNTFSWTVSFIIGGCSCSLRGRSCFGWCI